MEKRFVGAKEIQSWFGVSRQRIQQLIGRPDWPAPCAVLSMGKIWLLEDVEVWVARHRPKLRPFPGVDDQPGGGSIGERSARPDIGSDVRPREEPDSRPAGEPGSGFEKGVSGGAGGKLDGGSDVGSGGEPEAGPMNEPGK